MYYIKRKVNGKWMPMATTRTHIVSPNLPVTSADNGKFARVVNGQWAVAALDNQTNEEDEE